MKTCNDCFIEKELSFFTLDSRNKDGRQGICLECRKKRNYEARQAKIRVGNPTLVSHKNCNKCKVERGAEEFFKDAGTADGIANVCKSCKNEQVQAWRKKKKAEYVKEFGTAYPINKDLSRNRSLKFRYGISQVEYNAMLLKQEGKCAICKVIPSNRPLVVDHDHNTKEVRGLLCDKCNISIGIFDNKPLLDQAKRYLKI